MRRGTLCALFVLLAIAPAAHAVDLRASGAVTVRWQSNPDTCASAGLCGRSGVLSWRPGAAPAAVDAEERSFYALEVFGSTTTVWSERTVGDSHATCIDQPERSGLIGGTPRAGKVTFSMRDDASFSFGRCAGPLAADFQKALPVSQPVSLKSLTRHPRLDFRAQTEFQQGPFTGVVTSTLVFTTANSQPTGESISSGGSSTLTHPKTHKVRYGQLLATYTITRTVGDVGYSFRGLDDDLCAPFDTCGLTGDLSLHADITGGQLHWGSVRRLGAGRKETLATALRALRAGRTRVNADAYLGGTQIGRPQPLPLTASATPGGGDTCNDATSLSDAYLNATRASGGVRFRLENAGNTFPDPVRTRCPGPALSDIGLGGAFATGLLRERDFGSRTIELRLDPTPTFGAPGMAGSGHGSITVSLRLLSLKAATRTLALAENERETL